jgi:predicted nucleotide-binding protein
MSNSLKKLIPELYSDLPARKIPEPSEGGSIDRSFLETLKRDIEYIFEINAQFIATDSKITENYRRIFISHGTSKDWFQIQKYIEKDLEINTLELAQEPNKGRTVLQKLNEESDKCSYAVVIMTGDDIISGEEIRVRENVMHEIGFFQGKYGLEKVCLLYEEGTNIPSNIHGLVYIPFPKNIIDATFGSLSRELKAYFK